MRHAKETRGRRFNVGLEQSALQKIQAGTLRTRYKGRRFCKNPFDVVLYMRLIEKLKPLTIIEIGTSEGGSAIWFDDICQAQGLPTQILTFDISPPDGLTTERIQSRQLDSMEPEAWLEADMFRALPHPWLIIEDSAHTYDSVLAMLRYFDQHVQPGDYVVVEDGVVADLPGEHYEAYDDGPNRAVAQFLEEVGARYRIDEALCDYFGHNVTYCPNAWLRVVQPGTKPLE